MAGMTALAACAAPAAPGGGAAPQEGGGGEQPPAETTVVSLGLTWGASFQPRQAEFNERFMERHPEIELDVVYNTWSDHNNVVPTWAAANQLPDIIYVHGSRAFPWAFEGITVSLQDYVDSDPEFDIEGVWEEALRLYRFQGSLHGIPYDHGPMIIGYNKDIFDAAGMEYPKKGWTMDDFRDIARQLTNLDSDTPVWGYSGECPQFTSGTGPASFGGWGAAFLNDDETKLLVDSQEMRDAIQFWVDLIHVDKVAPTPAESQAFEQGPWMSGQVAMANVPSWETPGLAEFAAFQWDVVEWPTGPVQQQTGAFGSGFSITKDSTVPDQAWTFLREYLNVEGMEFMWGSSGRGSPARKAAYQSWMDSDLAPDNAIAYLEALENYAITGRPYQTLAAAELNDIQARQVTLLKAGETDVESAIQAIVEEGQPVLDEATARLRGG